MAELQSAAYFVASAAHMTRYNMMDLSRWAKIVAATSTNLTTTVKQMQTATWQMQVAFSQWANKWAEEREELKSPGVTPDIAGSVIGYRVWRVDSRFPQLVAIARNYVWKPGVVEAERCVWGEGSPHPHPFCDCGFWAMWDPTDVPYGPKLVHEPPEYVEVTTYGDAFIRRVLARVGGWTGAVMGQIEAWGVVVEAEYGFRAEKATVKKLYYPPGAEIGEGREFIHSIGEAYGVPVVEPNFEYNFD